MRDAIIATPKRKEKFESLVVYLVLFRGIVSLKSWNAKLLRCITEDRDLLQHTSCIVLFARIKI